MIIRVKSKLSRLLNASLHPFIFFDEHKLHISIFHTVERDCGGPASPCAGWVDGWEIIDSYRQLVQR